MLFKAPEQSLPRDGMASTTKPPDVSKTTPEPTPKKHKPELMIECLIDSLTANREKASKLQIVKLSENAITPTRGSAKAAGYDLYSAREVEIPARGKSLVETDIQVKVPEGTYGRIAPRSGLAWRNHVDIGAGVVDEDYRGHLKVVMFNHANDIFKVKKGERIAQLVCQKICYPEIEILDSLDETGRGEAGFGSTGAR